MSYAFMTVIVCMDGVIKEIKESGTLECVRLIDNGREALAYCTQITLCCAVNLRKVWQCVCVKIGV